MVVESLQTLTECPGCKKTVDPLRAPAVSVVEGRIAHFCSIACRERFLKRQTTAAASQPAEAQSEGAGLRQSVTGVEEAKSRIDPFPSAASEERSALLQTKLLKPQLAITISLLAMTVVVLFLPPRLDGMLSPIVAGVMVLARLILGLVRDRRTNPLRMLEGAALPLAAIATLAGGFFGLHLKLVAVTMSLLLSTESLGRLFELIGRHRSGVLSAVDDNQQVSLPASWRDNSSFSAKIKQLAMYIEWVRFPAAIAVGALTYFVTTGDVADALLSFATALVGINPRIIRMATGDSHLAAALIASKQGVVVRDAHAVDALANSRTALFIAKHSLIEPPHRVVDWQPVEDINEQSVLDALLMVESKAEGPVAEAIAEFAFSRQARAAATTEVEYAPGMGVVGTTPFGQLVCGSRQLLLDKNIPTGVMESHAGTIESSGRRAIFTALGGKLAAVFGLEETLVPHAEEAVQALRQQEMETAIITSAESLAAESLGKRLGIESVFFNMGEGRLGDALQAINARGDDAVLIGHGQQFEEHLRAATAAIAIGNIEKTHAGFDTRKSEVSIVPWLVKLARRANRSVMVNLMLGVSAVMLSLGIATSWFSPIVVLIIGAYSGASAAGTTFNAPYPVLEKLMGKLAAPIKAIQTFLRANLRKHP
jgi:YHS domain-containing protein